MFKGYQARDSMVDVEQTVQHRRTRGPVVIEEHFAGIEHLRRKLTANETLDTIDAIIFTCWYDYIPNWNGESATKKEDIIRHLGKLGFIHRPKIQYRIRKEADDETTRYYAWCFTRHKGIKTGYSRSSWWTTNRDRATDLARLCRQNYREIYKFLNQERAYNHKMLRWKKNQQKKIEQDFEMVDSRWSPISLEIDATIHYQNHIIAFANPAKFKDLKKRLKNVKHDLYACIGNPEYHNNEDVLFASLSKNHYPQSPQFKINVSLEEKSKGIVLATLIFNDFTFLKPWLNHYKNEGVKHFLIYYNHHIIPKEVIDLGENDDDVTIIPWPLTYAYKNSVKGKPDMHYAQPAMLHHAQFLCAEHKLGSHILNVDVDEYIIGNQPLSSIASENLTTEFLNYWAFNPPGIFGPHETKTLFNQGAYSDSVKRKKQLRPIAPFKPIYVHGSKHVNNISSEFIMLHFGLQSETNTHSASHNLRTDSQRKFVVKENLPEKHKIRRVFVNYLNRL